MRYASTNLIERIRNLKLPETRIPGVLKSANSPLFFNNRDDHYLRLCEEQGRSTNKHLHETLYKEKFDYL